MKIIQYLILKLANELNYYQIIRIVHIFAWIVLIIIALIIIYKR